MAPETDKDQEDKVMNDKSERRYFPIQEMRVSKGDDGEMIIEGYPIVYEKYANLWGYKEIILKGAATEALKKSDEFVLWNHLADQPMAGKRNGTLEAKEDDKGVFIRANVSKTIWGRNGYEAIDAGLVDKMSFAFDIKQDAWTIKEVDGVELDVREIVEFDMIYDYSPVTYPAYKDTKVVARSKELALRNKPKSEVSDDVAGAAALEVSKDAGENIEQRRKSNQEERKYGHKTSHEEEG
jgi:HK97 family phage prohead protease